MQLDNIDKAILRILQKDALAKLKDISSAINLSVSPTHDRIKRMESEGVIQNYVALIDRKKMELGMVVFCHVTLDKQTKNNFAEFEQTILHFDEIVVANSVLRPVAHGALVGMTHRSRVMQFASMVLLISSSPNLMF